MDRNVSNFCLLQGHKKLMDPTLVDFKKKLNIILTFCFSIDITTQAIFGIQNIFCSPFAINFTLTSETTETFCILCEIAKLIQLVCMQIFFKTFLVVVLQERYSHFRMHISHAGIGQ